MCRGISLNSELRTDVEMKSGHLMWAKKRQGSEVSDLRELFKNYWSSKKSELPVSSQS
jgi:hypothetical protein